MRRVPLLLLAAALVLAGCRSRPGTGGANPGTVPGGLTGSTLENVTVPGGGIRTYRLHQPAALPAGRPVPLLIALHGGGGSAAQFEETSGFDAVADAEGVIMAYPEGTPLPITRDGRVWNGGRCCPPADQGHRDVDDVSFLAAVIQALQAAHPVDPARVFVTGHSNGAIMALRLACERADLVAAVAVQAGTLEVDRCQPTRPVSVLDLHGTADRNIPLDGGRGDRSLSQTDFASPRASLATLARLVGCTGGPAPARAEEANPDVTHHPWAGCPPGIDVELRTVEGAGHAWMGHPTSLLQEAVVGQPYGKLDASATLWAFLAAHPRPA